MTSDEYRQLCDRLARAAIRHAAAMAEEDSPDHVVSERDHWIDVFLDEHLPDVDTNVLLEMTSNADAYAASTGFPAPSREVAASHAFQADVRDAIDRAEQANDPVDEETIARGMLDRHGSPMVAAEMAHWHAMDHAEGTPGRARWQRIARAIAHLTWAKR